MKISTKNILVALTGGLFFLFIAGCKKSPLDIITPDSEYYIRCKVDGSEKKWKIPDSAYFFTTPVSAANINEIKQFACSGVDDLNTMNGLSININDFTGSNIVAGKTYKTVVTGGITSTQAMITWNNLTGDAYVSVLSMIGPVKESAEITLTEITDKYVKGAFKGKLLVDEVNSATVKYNLTNGEFYLPRSRK